MFILVFSTKGPVDMTSPCVPQCPCSRQWPPHAVISHISETIEDLFSFIWHQYLLRHCYYAREFVFDLNVLKAWKLVKPFFKTNVNLSTLWTCSLSKRDMPIFCVCLPGDAGKQHLCIQDCLTDPQLWRLGGLP